MRLSREQLQFKHDNCAQNPMIMLVDLSKLASMWHKVWCDFYRNLSDAEKEHHQHVRTPEMILACVANCGKTTSHRWLQCAFIERAVNSECPSAYVVTA